MDFLFSSKITAIDLQFPVFSIDLHVVLWQGEILKTETQVELLNVSFRSTNCSLQCKYSCYILFIIYYNSCNFFRCRL